MLFDNWIGDKVKAQQTYCPPPLDKNHGVGWFTEISTLNTFVEKDTTQTSGTYSFTVNNRIIDGRGSGELVTITDHSVQYWLCVNTPNSFSWWGKKTCQPPPPLMKKIVPFDFTVHGNVRDQHTIDVNFSGVPLMPDYASGCDHLLYNIVR